MDHSTGTRLPFGIKDVPGNHAHIGSLRRGAGKRTPARTGKADSGDNSAPAKQADYLMRIPFQSNYSILSINIMKKQNFPLPFGKKTEYFLGTLIAVFNFNSAKT